MTWMRVVLLVLLAVVACVGMEQPSESELETVEEQVRLVEAYHHRRYEMDADGHTVQNRRVGQAKASTLEFLEEILLKRPRETFSHNVILPGSWGIGHGVGGKSNLWIRTAFSHGEVVDLRVWPDHVLVYGEKNLWIPLTREETKVLWDMESWDTTSSSWEDGPDPADNSWIGRNMSLEDFTLEDSPLVDGKGGVLLPISAERYSREDCWCVEDGVTRPHDLIPAGIATKEGLEDLADLLRRTRYIYLEFYPDGRREVPAWREEEPAEQIRCTLEDGAEITLNYYASEGAWCVEGEEGMRVGRRRNMMGRLLNEDSWSIPPADGQD